MTKGRRLKQDRKPNLAPVRTALDVIGDEQRGRMQGGQRLEQVADPVNGMLVGPRGCHYDALGEMMYYDVLKLCGCGRPELIHAMLVDCAREFEDGKCLSGVEQIVRDRPDVVAEFIAHFLDSKNILEHGTIVSGAWPTELGKQFIELGPLVEDSD